MKWSSSRTTFREKQEKRLRCVLKKVEGMQVQRERITERGSDAISLKRQQKVIRKK